MIMELLNLGRRLRVLDRFPREIMSSASDAKRLGGWPGPNLDMVNTESDVCQLVLHSNGSRGSDNSGTMMQGTLSARECLSTKYLM